MVHLIFSCNKYIKTGKKLYQLDFFKMFKTHLNKSTFKFVIEKV